MGGAPMRPTLPASASRDSLMSMRSRGPAEAAAAESPLQRRCGCLDHFRFSKASAQPSQLVERLAGQKRRGQPRRIRYSRFVAEAEAAVPSSVAKQIRLDVHRSFASLPRSHSGRWGWPPDEDEHAQQARSDELFRILIASEFRATTRLNEELEASSVESTQAQDKFAATPSSSSGANRASVGSDASSHVQSVYVQGCSLLAAMCLGFARGEEQEAFWLLQHLLEDVLGSDFFGSSPPLLGYHGDCAAVALLVASEAPNVAQMLGPRRLAEVTSALASRCLLSGFVGFMADGPMLALWEQLLEGHLRHPAYPRFTLLHWLVGLLRHLETEVALIAGQARPEELVPLLFKSAQQAALALPNDWQPSIQALGEARLQELRQLSWDASQAHLRSYKAREIQESHAKKVWQSLDRATGLLQDSMLTAQAMAAAGGATLNASASSSSP
mmetsp:Transcript_140911/g.450541  ORF Transcript_140911/g.450541 Transcript_140911/m.450541 type:complete len:443 (-) Transcript_140911:105-1433(-)